MILEYMPYRACEPILRTLISVSGYFHCCTALFWQICAACSRPVALLALPSLRCSGRLQRKGEYGHEQGQALCQRVLRERRGFV